VSRPAPVRRYPPEQRRRLIVDAAREVIASRGLSATRQRDVAPAAGVTHGTLTYHITTGKDQLATVIETEDLDFFQPVCDDALLAETGRDGLRCLVDGLFNASPRTREHWAAWLDFWTLANRDIRYGRWQDNSYTTWRKVLTELVARGEADGSLIVTNAELAVTQLMVLTDGVAAQAYLIGREPAVAIQAPGVLMWAMVAEMFGFSPDTDSSPVAVEAPTASSTAPVRA
jgi:AcrR family transcriptional regulator